MSDPENEGYQPNTEPNVEAHVTLRLSGPQLESVRVAIHRAIVDAAKSLEAMRAADGDIDDYEVLAAHVSNLESTLNAISAAVAE